MAKGKKILVLNGPNLNLLGVREPAHYGNGTLDDLKAKVETEAKTLGIEVDFRQSNIEGELVSWVQEAGLAGTGILINPGAYTHTSIALHDAIKSITVPVIEVHLSDPHKREAFRHISYVGMAAHSCIAGHGAKSYELALDVAARL